MYLSIRAPLYDDSGLCRLRIYAEGAEPALERRVSRTATLDGGVSLYDSGHAAGDMTIEATALSIDADQESVLKYLIRTYALVAVTVRGGCFRCAFVKFDTAARTLKFLVKEKLS